jgi:protein-L-isoaspartate(D-aspartate) O-methyltransferase
MRSRSRDDKGSPEHRRDALIRTLRHQGITDERVLLAIASVPREAFVTEAHARSAWENVALPIGSGQTISQPYVVAVMTQALSLDGNEKVLEIGTGSGYQTAILALLADKVISVERIAELAKLAEQRLDHLGSRNVTIMVGDGSLGWPDQAPYEAIMVTAAGPKVPERLLQQLDPDGGRLVMPVGGTDDQDLILLTANGGRLKRTYLGPVRFVPLIGEASWKSPERTRIWPDREGTKPAGA